MESVYNIIEKCDRLVDTVLLLFFIFCILIGGYGIYDSYLVYRNANDSSILKYKPKDGVLSEDGKISDDMVAWLTMDDTSIDYPVMQGKTNQEYLNKNPYGEYALSGSIFLDSNNSREFDDKYSLIYGHHMENKGMFGALADYTDEAFLVAHKTGELIAGNRSWKLHVFAILENVQATNEYVFRSTEHPVDEVLNEMKQYASYWENVDLKDKQIIALSTCQSSEGELRTVVVVCAE